jgi:hypothetical protein
VNWKTISLQDFKLDQATGAFHALFAPFLSVDHQGDVTLPGAIGEQRVIISAYDHASWTGELPAGKGRVFEGAEGGIVDGQFFLDTQAGSETYKTVKNLGDLQQWSYALPEIDFEMAKLQSLLDRGMRIQMNGHSAEETVRVLKRIVIPEVSPVLMGAGVDTRLIDIKSDEDKTITPGGSESESDFMSRCMSFYVGEGRDQSQAAAICHRTWDGKGKSTQLIDHLELVAGDARAVVEKLKHVTDLRSADGRGPGAVRMKRAAALKTAFEEMVRELARLEAVGIDEPKGIDVAMLAELTRFTLESTARR